MNLPTATQKGLLVLQVRAIIEFVLQNKGTIFYVPLAKSLKLFSGGKQIAEALGAIMEEDHAAGRALTCSLVISSQTGMPSKGFFDKARSLGYQFTVERDFWYQQLRGLGVTP